MSFQVYQGSPYRTRTESPVVITPIAKRTRARRRTSLNLTPTRMAALGIRRGGYSGINVGGGRGMLPEMKYIDTGLVSHAITNTGAVVLVATIAQGTNVSQRVGREVVLRTIQMNMDILCPQDTNLTTFHLALVWDKQPNKALAAWTDIFETGLGNTAWAFKNMENRKRFTILKIWRRHTIGGRAEGTEVFTDKSQIKMDYFRKLNHKMEFGTTGNGGIGDITTGALLFTYIAGVSAAGNEHPTMLRNFRVRYQDP